MLKFFVIVLLANKLEHASAGACDGINQASMGHNETCRVSKAPAMALTRCICL